MNIPAVNNEVVTAKQIAQSIAKEYTHANFSGAHLLRGVLNKELTLRPYLQKAGKDVYYMEDWADVRLEQYPKASRQGEPVGDEKIKAVFDEAENIRIKLAKDNVDLMCVFGALCTPGIAFTYDQLKTFPVLISELIAEGQEDNAFKAGLGNNTIENGQNAFVASGAIAKYCTDKTAECREGKIEAITGRDLELRMIAEILGRRSKANVMITGEPGVGKTALVNGLVLDIANGKVAENLKGTLVYQLDPGAFISGASYKGEAEDRMQNIIKELQQFDKAILFTDNIHGLLDKNGPAPGLINILKSELSKGKLTIIGTSTNDGHRKFIEPEETFNRLFELVKLEEPSEHAAVRMVNMIVPHLEEHHQLKLNSDVVLEAVRLARRYLKERSLPDSAIDLVDRAMSAINMMEQTSALSIGFIQSELSILLEKKDSYSVPAFIAELQWLFSVLKNRVGPLLLNQAEVNEDHDADTIAGVQTHLESMLNSLSNACLVKRHQLEKSDIAAIIAAQTGIPLGKLQSQEKDKLISIEQVLNKRVIGQDNAIRSVSEAILESRSGLSKPGQPIGSFFFMGPTGTGKTELAKSLAEFLFDDESALIRFDMSEFKEEHSAALLYGAPPGYVGYEEGGMLVNKIRQKPYAVILFDEIEKAHASVFDLFLQIMDEGKLHDRLGKEGDFANAVVLFTSNIGSDFVMESFNKGITPKAEDLMEIMTRHFRPEFLARLTEIVPFSPITEKMVYNIFSIHLNHLLKMLEKQGITLLVDERAKEHLSRAGFTPKYGARPIQGVIRSQIRRPLSRMIITGELQKGDTITLGIDDRKVLQWTKQTNNPAENSLLQTESK